MKGFTLAIKTDQPQAEIYLLDQTGASLDQTIWEAHYELSKTLLPKIIKVLQKNKLTLQSLGGLVVFKGPGSFTGLRIGIATANALAYGLQIPIAGASGKDWLKSGFEGLNEVKVGEFVLPKYGRPPHITQPKK